MPYARNMGRNGAAGNGEGTARATFCVVDKDARVRSALCSPLRAIGLEVHGFEDAAEFLLSGLSYRCVGLIAEWKMKSMSGYDLLRALGAAALPMATIFTVHGHEEVSAVSALPGVSAVLMKPIAEVDLISAVRHSLTRPA